MNSAQLCRKCGKPGEFRPRHKQCRDCQRAHVREQARLKPRPPLDEKEKARRRKLNVEIARRRKAELHAKLDKVKSVPCSDCQKQYAPCVMDFDHRDPSTKETNVSRLVGYGSGLPWKKIEMEIAKCDLVCANCHRLRTWTPPKTLDTRRRLIISLKGETCADCGGRWHYCQLDFDHVKGGKIDCVTKMGSAEAIRAEAAKCEVVCANCHRLRTMRRGHSTPRNDPSTIDMVWKQKTGGLQSLLHEKTPVSRYQENGAPPRPRPWHPLAGTMPDTEVARGAGVSKSMVALYRKRRGIPAFGTSLEQNCERSHETTLARARVPERYPE